MSTSAKSPLRRPGCPVPGRDAYRGAVHPRKYLGPGRDPVACEVSHLRGVLGAASVANG
ncbi:MAG TPA: hypothetical protein VF054_08520 [Micromonosporaceae bacterium]